MVKPEDRTNYVNYVECMLFRPGVFMTTVTANDCF